MASSDQDQVDTFSVTSGGSMMYRGGGGGGASEGGGRVYLTPAQVGIMMIINMMMMMMSGGAPAAAQVEARWAEPADSAAAGRAAQVTRLVITLLQQWVTRYCADCILYEVWCTTSSVFKLQTPYLHRG